MPRLSPPRSKRVTVEDVPGEEVLPTEDVVIELSESDLDGLTIEVAEEPDPLKTEPEPAPDPDEAVRNAVEA